MSDSIHNPGTRERILAFLQANKSVTVSEISRTWGLTRADVRYHLKKLVNEGLAEIVPSEEHPPAKRGRPVIHYRLAAHLAPNNFPELCSTLLELYLASFPEEARSSAIMAAAHHMVDELPKPAPLFQRLNAAIAYLNLHGYHAHWEASPAGPRLFLRNCPYSAILDRHPELCQFDRMLLERLGRLALEQKTRINLAAGGPAACIFISTGWQAV